MRPLGRACGRLVQALQQLADGGQRGGRPLPAILQLYLHAGQFGGNGAAVGIHQGDERIAEAVHQSSVYDGLIDHREQTRAERKQVAGQVSAIHGGDVERLQRLEGLRVVPVEEMSAMPFQPVQGVKGLAGAVGKLAGRDVAEIVGRQIRQQGEPDIGGRGAMRDARDGLFLIVVGRQPVVFGAGEGLKEVPGLASQLAQEDVLFRRQMRRGAAPPGRLNHQAMLGERNQSPHSGHATSSAVGRSTVR